MDTVTKDGLLLFKVAFEIKPPADGGRTPAVAGWILCDPAAHWIIRESEVELRRVEFNTRDVVRNVYEYREGTDGFPTVNRVVQDYQRPSTGHHNRFTWEFELKDSEAPEETFMLSGYGLPELRTGSSPTPTRWYLWVLAAALGCFALAVVLRRRASLRGNT